MTIKEFATLQGISTQAVYNKLKTAGVKLQVIKQGNTAELTEDGENILKGLFASNLKNSGNTCKNFKVENDLKALENALQEVENLKKELETVTEDRDRWKAQAEEYAEIAKSTQKFAERMQDLLIEAQAATQRAQALDMARIQSQMNWWQRRKIKRIQAAKENEQHKKGV